MLFAGRAPYTLHGELTGSRDTYVHFVQDPFDIASIVRPYVKWEYSLPSGVVVKEALARARAFMQSDPPGPVYMTLPRETLAEQWHDAAMPTYPAARYGSVQAGGIEQARVDAIAGQLMAAENPIALTAYVPYVPQYAKRAHAIKWIQIDIDPLKADFPMWGFPTDMRIQGDCATVLQQVLDAVEARADDAYRKRVTGRIASWSVARETSAKRRATASANKGVTGALNPAFVFATLSAKLSPDDVVLNEAIRNGPVLQEHVARTKPQSYVGLAGGGLGFSGGMALGLKLAKADRRIVQVIGDGGFHFSSPDSVYAVAQQYQIPIFTVVLDNGGWQAVKSAVQRVYPKGIAAETDQFQSRLTSGRQGDRRDFSEVAKAFGAYGECVTEPDQLAAAIDRSFAALDDGKAAVLHVYVTRL
jgi:acetolactate synthase-1/2/3 large subunit